MHRALTRACVRFSCVINVLCAVHKIFVVVCLSVTFAAVLHSPLHLRVCAYLLYAELYGYSSVRHLPISVVATCVSCSPR